MAIPATTSSGLSYDIVPMLYPQLFEHVAKYSPLGFIGHEIILSTDDLSSASYVGLNKHKQRYATLLSATVKFQEQSEFLTLRPFHGIFSQIYYSLPYTGLAHLYQLYSSVLKSQLDAKRPIPITGFVLGSRCNEDEECQSGYCKSSLFSKRRCASQS
jgi:hypothetical protein